METTAVTRPMMAMSHRGRSLPPSATHRLLYTNAKAINVEIAKAVEEIFGVEVAKVNTLNMKGKTKRVGRYPEGRRNNWKKAMVTLTADSKTIEFFEGMV